jgi:hypothetical protein
LGGERLDFGGELIQAERFLQKTNAAALNDLPGPNVEAVPAGEPHFDPRSDRLEPFEGLPPAHSHHPAEEIVNIG